MTKMNLRLFATLAVAFAVYTFIFVAFSSHVPSWGDEVEFADPAANLYFNKRFVTTAWPYQTVEEVFFGNAPLFSLLLGAWFHLVDFGIFQARLLSWLLACIGICASVAATINLRLLPTRYIPFAVVLFLSGYGLTISIWSVRYDMLGFAIVATILYGLTDKGPLASALRRSALALVVAAGFHLVFVVAPIYALKSIFERRISRSTIFDLLVMIAGGAALLGYYAYEIGIKRFLLLTIFSNHTIMGQTARGSQRGFFDFLHEKTISLLSIFYQDPSYSVIVVLSILLFLLVWRKKNFKAVEQIDIGLFVGAILLPILLCGIGKYPAYYSWIGWSCLCVLFVRLWTQSIPFNNVGRMLLVGICSLSALVGLANYVRTHAQPRSLVDEYADLESAIVANTRANEIFYADDAAYFQTWRRARHVYVATYAQNYFLPGYPTSEPVTSMVVQEGQFERVKNLVGGDWTCVWKATTVQAPGMTPLEICRRTAHPNLGLSSRR